MKKRVLSMLLTSTLCAGVIPNTSTVFAVENISDNTTSAEKTTEDSNTNDNVKNEDDSNDNMTQDNESDSNEETASDNVENEDNVAIDDAIETTPDDSLKEDTSVSEDTKEDIIDTENPDNSLEDSSDDNLEGNLDNDLEDTSDDDITDNGTGNDIDEVIDNTDENEDITEDVPTGDSGIAVLPIFPDTPDLTWEDIRDSMSISVLADGILDVNDGPITITKTGYTQNGGSEVAYTGPYTISGTITNAKDEVITIEDENADITLSNLTIEGTTTTQQNAFIKIASPSATLKVDGDLTLTNADTSKLIIVGTYTDGNSYGSSINIEGNGYNLNFKGITSVTEKVDFYVYKPIETASIKISGVNTMDISGGYSTTAKDGSDVVLPVAPLHSYGDLSITANSDINVTNTDTDATSLSANYGKVIISTPTNIGIKAGSQGIYGDKGIDITSETFTITQTNVSAGKVKGTKGMTNPMLSTSISSNGVINITCNGDIKVDNNFALSQQTGAAISPAINGDAKLNSKNSSVILDGAMIATPHNYLEIDAYENIKIHSSGNSPAIAPMSSSIVVKLKTTTGGIDFLTEGSMAVSRGRQLTADSATYVNISGSSKTSHLLDCSVDAISRNGDTVIENKDVITSRLCTGDMNITSSKSITVYGNAKDTLIGKNITAIATDGDINITNDGFNITCNDYGTNTLTASGNINVTANSAVYSAFKGELKAESKGNIILKNNGTGGTVFASSSSASVVPENKITAGGTVSILNSNSNDKTPMLSGGNFTINSTGDLTIEAGSMLIQHNGKFLFKSTEGGINLSAPNSKSTNTPLISSASEVTFEALKDINISNCHAFYSGGYNATLNFKSYEGGLSIVDNFNTSMPSMNITSNSSLNIDTYGDVLLDLASSIYGGTNSSVNINSETGSITVNRSGTFTTPYLFNVDNLELNAYENININSKTEAIYPASTSSTTAKAVLNAKNGNVDIKSDVYSKSDVYYNSGAISSPVTIDAKGSISVSYPGVKNGSFTKGATLKSGIGNISFDSPISGDTATKNYSLSVRDGSAVMNVPVAKSSATVSTGDALIPFADIKGTVTSTLADPTKVFDYWISTPAGAFTADNSKLKVNAPYTMNDYNVLVNYVCTVTPTLYDMEIYNVKYNKKFPNPIFKDLPEFYYKDSTGTYVLATPDDTSWYDISYTDEDGTLITDISKVEADKTYNLTLTPKTNLEYSETADGLSLIVIKPVTNTVYVAETTEGKDANVVDTSDKISQLISTDITTTDTLKSMVSKSSDAVAKAFEEQTTDKKLGVAVVSQNNTLSPNGYKGVNEISGTNGIKLLFDELLDTEKPEVLNAKMNDELGLDINDYNADYKYMNIVDNKNGNLWLKASDGVLVFWPYPDGTDKYTNFRLVHYKSVQRSNVKFEEAVANNPVHEVDIINTDYGVAFYLPESDFSPFTLLWEKVKTIYDIEIDQGANGTVTSDKNSATAGEDIKLTVTPDNNFELDKIIVTDKNGNEIEVDFTTNADGTITFPMTNSPVTITPSFEKVETGSSSGSTTSKHYNVIVEESSNGTVSSSHKTAGYGKEVTLTVSADKGYILETITVTTTNGENLNVKLTYNADGTISFHMPASDVIVNATFVANDVNVINPDSDNIFDDVNKDDWFYDYVKDAFENGLISGMDENHFGPYITTTRGMIATLVHRLEGTPQTDFDSAYPDVLDNHYYTEAVDWGTEYKVLWGYGNGLYGPEDLVTREQLVSILYRYANYKGLDTSIKGDLSAFTDADNITGYALPGMKWAVANGLIAGRTSDTLEPTAYATRAEVLTIFVKIHRLIYG